MDLDIARKALETGIGFVHRTGLKIDALERGYVKCSMPFAGNGNHIGTMYAGALFTVAEIPGGALFLSSFDSRRFFPIVKAMDLAFIRPAKSDVSVEIALDDARIEAIQAEAAASGKAEFVLEGEITDSAGVTVARSRGVYQLRRIG